MPDTLDPIDQLLAVAEREAPALGAIFDQHIDWGEPENEANAGLMVQEVVQHLVSCMIAEASPAESLSIIRRFAGLPHHPRVGELWARLGHITVPYTRMGALALANAEPAGRA